MIESLKWGEAPTPLLPEAVRKLWQAEPLPQWLTSDLNVPMSTTLGELNTELWRQAEVHLTPRVVSFSHHLLTDRRPELSPQLVLPQGWPEGLSPTEVPFSVRVVNCLKSAGIYKNASALGALTFQNLFGIKNLGVKSVLEYACVAEAAIAEYRRSEPQRLLDAEREQEAKRGRDVRIATLRRKASALLDAVRAEPWAKRISIRDPRFVKLSAEPGYSLVARLQRIVDLLPISSDPDRLAEDLALAENEFLRLQELWSELASLSLDETIEQVLDLIVRTARDLDTRKHVIKETLQWHGADRRLMLEEAGAQLGLTRERIRQIEAKAVSRLISMLPLAVPTVHRAVKIVSDAAPCSVAEAGMRLQEEGLSAKSFSPLSLAAVADSLAIDRDFEIIEVAQRQFLARKDDGLKVEQTIALAKRLCRASGASSLERLGQMMTRSGTDTWAAPQLRRLIRGCGGSFVDDAQQWFCFSRHMDTVTGVVTKMLSVSRPLPVELIRRKLRRVQVFRRSSAEPDMFIPMSVPSEVLLQVLLLDPRFRLVNAGMLDLTIAMTPEERLGQMELALIRAIAASSTQSINRDRAIDVALALGLSAATATMLLSYSPVIERIGPNRWTTIGTSPAFAPSLRSERHGVKDRLVDFGWTPTARPYVRFIAPDPRRTSSFYVTMPAGIRSHVPLGQYEAMDEEGGQCGTVNVTRHGTFSGLTRYFRLAAVEEGDVVEAVFETAERRARLTVCDEEQEGKPDLEGP